MNIIFISMSSEMRIIRITTVQIKFLSFIRWQSWEQEEREINEITNTDFKLIGFLSSQSFQYPALLRPVSSQLFRPVV